MSSLRSEYTEDEYRFTTDDGQVAIRMYRFRVDTRSGLKAEVEVRWNGTPNPGLLKSSDLNLNAGTTIKQWANELEARVPDQDWYATLTAATQLAKERYRQGDPPILLGDVDRTDRPRWLVRPILEYGGPTVVAAKGGSLKSMLGLAVLLTKTTARGKFLGINASGGAALGGYFDWEANAHTHVNRVEALCRGAGVDVDLALNSVYYRREFVPLYESVEELARYVRNLGLSMVVIDSKGAALGGAPEDAEVTLRFFAAVRKLGVPCLVIDHVTNETADGRGPKRPHGSVYTQNLARNVWFAEKVDEQLGEVTVQWTHIKSNNGPVGRKMGWRVELDMDDEEEFERVTIHPESVVNLSIKGEGADSLRGKLRAILTHHTAKGEFLTVMELVHLTGQSEGSVRARLNEGRMDNEFLNVAAKGVPGRWLLAAGAPQTAELPNPWSE